MAPEPDSKSDGPSLTLPTPDSFPIFPYPEPYNIQLDLMRHLYAAIEGRKIAIVESPTGTVGRSLSPGWGFD